MKIFTKILPYLPYGILAGLVLGPLLLPGFVLTMDMVFTPDLKAPMHVDNTFVLYWTLHILGSVLPADALQKIILLAILLLSGIGMHRLVWMLRPVGERFWLLATYIAGLFYTINPFVYDRFMAGQYGVLLGYAILPWFVAASFTALQKPSMWRALRLGLWLTLISIVSIHSVGFAVIIVVAAAIAYPLPRNRWSDYCRYGGVVIAVFFVLSSYWLLPAMIGQGRIADSIATFGSSQRQAFEAADTNGETSLAAVLGLQGFWQDTRGLYILPIDATPQWGFVRLAVLSVIGFGAMRAWREQRRRAIFFGSIGGAGAVLGLGVFGNALAQLPFFAGYREPQKFVALLAISYGYFMAWGMHALMARAAQWRNWARYAVAAIATLLVLAYTSPMLWGFYGQLRTAHYPADWRQVNAKLNTVVGNSRVLYLPWHLYMSYDFAGRIIASPAPAYFDKPIIVSDNPELPGVAPQFHDATKQTIQRDVLPAAATGTDIAPRLRMMNIHYVLLAKEWDYANYNYLAAQPRLTIAMQTEHFTLYQVNE